MNVDSGGRGVRFALVCLKNHQIGVFHGRFILELEFFFNTLREMYEIENGVRDSVEAFFSGIG